MYFVLLKKLHNFFYNNVKLKIKFCENKCFSDGFPFPPHQKFMKSSIGRFSHVKIINIVSLCCVHFMQKVKVQRIDGEKRETEEEITPKIFFSILETRCVLNNIQRIRINL